MARPRVLVFGASNSRKSINRQFAVHAADVLNQQTEGGVEIEVLDLNDFEMPIYSPDREAKNGIPDEAHRYLARLKAADALVIAFPEHNGYVSAAYKNLFDWASRIDQKVYQNKPMVILSATPGPRAGAGVLGAVEHLAPFFGGQIRGRFGLGAFQESFDRETRSLVDPKKQADLYAALSALILDPA